ncbi:hypothetical protein LK542_07425 [Massilia sp. IC2-477]|uniref:T6SS immunity protein Tli4 family protein n=1 Tax=Massilia sp. IC2-477 TaxID=2887198 RepID=UPI001D12B8C1|nr:hypothetical protein [Massilia sp. IC2-477]
MNKWIQDRLARVLAGITCAGLIMTWAVGNVIEGDTARRSHDEVAQMTGKMKTVCVGRFLIDMPADAQIELARPNIDGFDMAVFNETTEEFHKRLADREAQVKAMPDYTGGNRNLELVREVKTDHGVIGKVFAHSRKVTEGTRARGLEIERYRNEGIAIEALVHADGVSFDLASEYYDPDLIDNLPKLVAKLEPIPDGRVPLGSGFCIGRAHFLDPLLADQGERVMMFARLPDHPDVEFMMILAAGQKPDEQGLLERSSDAEDRLSLNDRMRITRIRAAPRTIGGLSGEELVKRGVEANDAQVYSFWWEVNGKEDDVFVPHIVFKMATGKSENGPVPTSMSEEAALGLWDRISSTIRLRPTQAQEAGNAVTPESRLGMQAWAGDRCPHSGWWVCSDGSSGTRVLGGQRQYIKQGERMPQALLLLPQSLWEKLRGLQPTAESSSRTAWKLVDNRARKRVPPTLPLAKASVAAGITMIVSQTHDADGQQVAVGSFSSTGSPCPASGWWRCEESHALDGTRWFAQGSLLPPATFAVAPGIFGHAPNAPQAIQRRSAWRLMRLGEAPDQVGSV